MSARFDCGRDRHRRMSARVPFDRRRQTLCVSRDVNHNNLLSPAAYPAINEDEYRARSSHEQSHASAGNRKQTEVSDANAPTQQGSGEAPDRHAAGDRRCGEILDDLSDVDTVIVPVSGGGLISGIATAIKETTPSVRVIGVELALTAKYSQSWINTRSESPFRC